MKLESNTNLQHPQQLTILNACDHVQSKLSDIAARVAVSLADRAGGFLFQPFVKAGLVKLVTALQMAQRCS